MDWERAENHLNMLIAEYSAIGGTGQIGLQITLLPLKRRFDAGERTDKLYEEIMQCG